MWIGGWGGARRNRREQARGERRGARVGWALVGGRGLAASAGGLLGPEKGGGPPPFTLYAARASVRACGRSLRRPRLGAFSLLSHTRIRMARHLPPSALSLNGLPPLSRGPFPSPRTLLSLSPPLFHSFHHRSLPFGCKECGPRTALMPAREFFLGPAAACP